MGTDSSGKLKNQGLTDDQAESNYPSRISLADDPQNVAENLGETAGGAQISDPSDIPGGVLGRGEDMIEAAADAIAREQIDTPSDNRATSPSPEVQERQGE